jgi:hypothetical protein
MWSLQICVCTAAVVAVAQAQTFAFDYSLADQNAQSPTVNQNVGPSAFPGKITLHYFGHQS